MNKRGKIIVSIAAIFIILLALIGITYGYFLTRVTGNTEENSILITTANLELVYGDGNGIITASNIYPVTEEDKYNIEKTFTVSNNGNSYTTYGVYLENVINTFEDKKDVKLTISCSSNKTMENGETITTSCIGFSEYNEEYPSVNKQLFTMGIEVSEVHTYTLKVRYADDGTDQSYDMGKTLSGKIQIYDPNDVFSIEGSVVSATISEDTIQDGTTGKLDETKYYVEVQSDPTTSQISSDGSYNVNGLKPGTHTVYVKSKADNSVVASKTLSVKKGVVSGIDDEGVITVNEEDSRVIVDLSVDTTNKSMVLDASSVEFKYEDSPVEWFTFDSSTQTATLNTEVSGTEIDLLVIPKTINSVVVKNVYVEGANVTTVITKSGLETFDLNMGSIDYIYLSDTVTSIDNGMSSYGFIGVSSNNSNLMVHSGSLFSTSGELMMYCGDSTYTLPEFTTKISQKSGVNFNVLTTLNIPENVAKVLTIDSDAFQYVQTMTVNIHTAKSNTSLVDPVDGMWYSNGGSSNITVNWITE